MTLSLREAWAELEEALYPATCAFCRRACSSSGRGCEEHALEPARPGPRCGRCATRLAPMLVDGTRCRACRERRPAFARVVAASDYVPGAAVRDWLLAFKHGGRRDLARPLGAFTARRLAAEWAADPELRGPLVPVPLHPWRRFERGYDQAALLAEEVARSVGGTMRRFLARRRATTPQGAAGSHSRRANVRDAFGLRRGARRRLAGTPRVWLVDDVLTSGATADACARVLRRAGVAEVCVLCVARSG